MGREINLDSILALDAEIIRLKRTRNSLLNIARIPPEILGHIFCFNIMEPGDPDLAGIPEGSYNFLLVCHHWFQVGLRTPELWTSWGNKLKDWKRRYHCSGISALDLILDGWNNQGRVLNEALQDALRDRAARDVIRKVHLKGEDTELLATIISALIPEGEDVRTSSIESIVLSNVDVSVLFARHRFPKLHNLHLSGNFKILSWDHLESTTTALTSLSLDFNDVLPSSAIPTMSQICSFLASNPNLRSLTLSTSPINDDGGDGPRLQLPLRYISLLGPFHRVFRILHRLELPERVDYEDIMLYDCTPQEVLEVIGPHIRDYLRRDPRFGDRLWMLVSSTVYYITFHASVVGVGCHGPDRVRRHGPPYGKFMVVLSQPISHHARERLCTDVLALLPQESIVSFDTDLSVTEEILVTMPNLEALYLTSPAVSDRFLLPDPDGPNAHKKLLPSLQRLCLRNAEAVDGDWEPLVNYLAHQTSGNQVVSLSVFGGIRICSEVIEQIDGLVEELVYAP